MKYFCINLEHRPDRLALAEKEFMWQDMEVEFHVAKAHKTGWMGCRDSHLRVLEKGSEFRAFGVFEDDVRFDWSMSFVTDVVLNELPEDWDMLYLGANIQYPVEPYSGHLFRLYGAWCAHAILYNNRIGGVVDYIISHRSSIKKYDVFLTNMVLPQFNCFVVYPMVCDQRVSKSDICSKTDVSQIRKNYNKFIRYAVNNKYV